MKTAANKLFNNKFEIIKEETRNITRDSIFTNFYNEWDQYLRDSDSSIFTKKAQEHILKILGIKAKNISVDDYQLLGEQITNSIIVVTERYSGDSGKALKSIYIEVGTFVGIVNRDNFGDKFFEGIFTRTEIELKLEELGLVRLLPNCTCKWVRHIGIDNLMYGTLEEREELKKELLAELG